MKNSIPWIGVMLYLLIVGLIAGTIYLTRSGWPLWALLIMPEMTFKDGEFKIETKL